MDGWESLALIALVVLAMGAVAAILFFAGVGAASGYFAGGRAPSSTGRSGAMAGLAIGAVMGVVATALSWLAFIDGGPTWAILLIGVLAAIIGPALFAYRRDSRISRILFLVSLALAVAVVAVTAALSVGTWSWYGEFNEPGGPLPDDSLLWQYETGNQHELVIVSPTLADGVVYASSHEGIVYALDAQTGELLWRFETGSALNPPPTVAGGVVYVEKAGGGLWELDALTGELLRNDETLYEDLLLSDGTLYIPIWRIDGDFSVNIRAIDESSGDLRWEADVPRSSGLPLLFPLTASGRNIYVSDDYQVRALDSTTGKLAWSFDAGDVVEVPPGGADGVVYLRSYSAACALDESTGEQLWRYEVDHGGLARPPAVADGVWALVDGGGDVHALDAATGQPLWSYEDDYVSFVSGVANGIVFVTGDEAFHALDAETGRKMWSLYTDWGLGEVTVVDGVLYANSLDGYLHILDARTGELILNFEIGYHLVGTDKPYVVSGGVMYVGYQLADSGVYALSAPGGGR